MTRKRKEQYKALAILCIGFCLIGWRFHQWWLICVMAVVLIAGLVYTAILTAVTDAWRWIGEQMGAVTSRIILTVVFIFFLSPIAFLYRLLAKKQDEKKESYFVERNHTYTASDLEKLF